MAYERLAMENQNPQVAFYYQNPIWQEGDWVKNLLLFFDGIALLVPHYLREKPFAVDPAIAEGLRQQNLLTILEPETFLDKKAANELGVKMADIVASGALDRLAESDTAFHELSWSRLGGMADSGVATSIYKELKKRGLAKSSKDGASIPMHPVVRSLVLVLLSQILRPAGAKMGLDLQPVTDRPEINEALMELLGVETAPSAGHVVSLDLETVGVDLRAVPIDEVLSFRAEHIEEYQQYARDLRRFVRELALFDCNEQENALRDRRAELKDRAAELRQTTWRAWQRGGSFALGLAGAAWTLDSGNALGAVLAAGAVALAAGGTQPQYADAYSYLFRAKDIA